MTKLGLLCTTALLAGTMAVVSVNAGDNATPEVNVNYVVMTEYVQTDRVSPKSSQPSRADRDVFDQHTVQGLLETLYDAQIALHNDNAVDAEEELKDAIGTLDIIVQKDVNGDNRINARDVRSYSDRKVIDVRFGDILTPAQAVMPAGHAELTVNRIDSLLDLEALEDGSVEEAKVRYISYNVDYADIRQRLVSAQAELAQQDYTSASFDVLQAQDLILQDRNELMVPARLQAKDHIELTRFLLEKGEYRGARQSLGIASDALGVLRGGTDDKLAVMAMETAIDQLRLEIAQKDLSLLERIDATFENLLDELS